MEIDVARTLWDYRTNSPGAHSSPPDLTRMLNEFAAAGNFGQQTAYERLRLGIAAASGCEAYKRFVYYAAANGADHCDGACFGCAADHCNTTATGYCDDVPGCQDCDALGCP